MAAEAGTGSGPAIYRATHELTDSMREFLSRQRYAALGTRNADGSVHVVPVIYRFDGQRFLVAAPSTTRKARNIAARQTATVTVDDREEIRWVSARGTAELIRGQTAYELNQSLYRLWMTDEGLAVVGAYMATIEDVTIAITPHAWQAWDLESTYLPVLADAGVPLDNLNRLFVI
jgi:PPOX class probable F420-dependent enzyme